MKGDTFMRVKLKHGEIMADFQQIFAAFCVLMAEACCHFAPPICIFLFFRDSASKSCSVLINDNATDTNPIQTNYDSNVAIRTFDHEPKQTFSNDLSRFVGTASMPSAEASFTNRIQREFLFNNHICSQNQILYSRTQRQKTNLLKPCVPNLALLSLSAKIAL
jgi:hypothetical protein